MAGVKGIQEVPSEEAIKAIDSFVTTMIPDANLESMAAGKNVISAIFSDQKVPKDPFEALEFVRNKLRLEGFGGDKKSDFINEHVITPEFTLVCIAMAIAMRRERE